MVIQPKGYVIKYKQHNGQVRFISKETDADMESFRISLVRSNLPYVVYRFYQSNWF